jgi:hypothetical protein
MKQLTAETMHPMLGIASERHSEFALEVITGITLHVNWSAKHSSLIKAA